MQVDVFLLLCWTVVLPYYLVVLPYYPVHLGVVLLCYQSGAALVQLSAMALVAKRPALVLSKPGEQYW